MRTCVGPSGFRAILVRKQTTHIREHQGRTILTPELELMLFFLNTFALSASAERSWKHRDQTNYEQSTNNTALIPNKLLVILNCYHMSIYRQRGITSDQFPPPPYLTPSLSRPHSLPPIALLQAVLLEDD